MIFILSITTFSIIILTIIIIFIIIYDRANKIKNDKTLYINNIYIPKNIYLCYKSKDIPDYIIPNWKKLNPDYNVYLYDNDDCKEFLLQSFGQEYVDCFNYIKDGPIKADFWRVCILYQYGGVYSDIDVEPLVPIDSIIDKDVSFLSCISMTKNELNPHIIITGPKNPIIKECIDKYVDYYDNMKPYSYWGWSIVHIMTNILYKQFGKYINNEGIYEGNDGNNYQFIKEVFKYNLSDIYCTYKNIKVLNNRYRDYNPDNHHFNLVIKDKTKEEIKTIVDTDMEVSSDPESNQSVVSYFKKLLTTLI